MPNLKRFDFIKEDHRYSFYYDDVKEFINHLVDIADEDSCNLDLMDIFSVVRHLARNTAKMQKTIDTN